MEKWNFDYLFSGSTEQQMEKQIDFCEGLKSVVRRRREDFAHEVLRGSRTQEGSHSEVVTASEALEAFRRDPRIEAMRRQGAEDLLRKAVDEVFGPKK